MMSLSGETIVVHVANQMLVCAYLGISMVATVGIYYLYFVTAATTGAVLAASGHCNFDFR